MDSETITERYERLAAAFYAETGMMAPGKDDSLGHHPYEMRLARWQEWLTARDPQPRPAAPHAAPREGELTVVEDSDALRRAIWNEPRLYAAYTLGRQAEAEWLAQETDARLASQQAALDAAGEEMDRLIEWRDEYSLFHGPKCSQARSYRGIGERVCTCGSVRLRKMLDAIAAARASHPEARDGE